MMCYLNIIVALLSRKLSYIFFSVTTIAVETWLILIAAMRPTYTFLLPWLANPSYGFIVSALRHASRRLLPLRLRGILLYPWKSCVASPPLFLHHLWCRLFPFLLYISFPLSRKNTTSLVDCYIISRSSPTHCTHCTTNAIHGTKRPIVQQLHVGVPRWSFWVILLTKGGQQNSPATNF